MTANACNRCGESTASYDVTGEPVGDEKGLCDACKEELQTGGEIHDNEAHYGEENNGSYY